VQWASLLVTSAVFVAILEALHLPAALLLGPMIAGIVVGVGLGWFLDRVAGTSPWGLIVGLLLGFGAGVLNVLRSAGVVAEFGQSDKPRDPKE